YEKEDLPVKQQQWEEHAREEASLPAAIQKILLAPEDGRSEAQRAELAIYFRSIAPEYASLKAVVPVGDEVGNNKPLPPSEKALIVAENSSPRKSFVQRKGDFLQPGLEVEPATPAFLPPLKMRGHQPDRLDLA